MKKSHLLFMIVALCGLTACGQAEPVSKTAPEKRLPVEVMTAAPTSFTERYTVSALAAPIQVHHLSAEVAGTLVKLNVDVGDKVSSGQVLATLDAEPLTLARDTAQARADRAAVRVSLAQKTFARQQRLHGQGSVADSVFEDADLNLQLAKADLRLARLTLKSAERDLAHGVIKAPIDGEITGRFPELGAVLPAGTPVFHLVRTDRVRLVLSLSESEVVHVAAGDPVSIAFDALPKAHFSGTVARVGSVDQGASPTFPVEVHMDNQEGQVRPGMVARVTLSGRTLASAVPVPATALRRRNGDTGLFVIDGERAVWIKVNVATLEDEIIYLDSGINAGTQVVIVGQTALRGGELVSLSVVDGRVTEGARKAPAVYGLP